MTTIVPQPMVDACLSLQRTPQTTLSSMTPSATHPLLPSVALALRLLAREIAWPSAQTHAPTERPVLCKVCCILFHDCFVCLNNLFIFLFSLFLGKAYLYTKSGQQWVLHHSFSSGHVDGTDSFGTRVTINEEDVVVGAPNSNNGSGRVYAYYVPEISG